MAYLFMLKFVDLTKNSLSCLSIDLHNRSSTVSCACYIIYIINI